MLVLILWLRGCDLGTMWEEFRGFVNLRNDRTSCAPISVTLVLTLISIYLNSTHLMFHFNLVLFPKCLTLKSSVRTHFSENSAVFMGYPRLHKNNISDSMDDQWLTMHIWSTFSSMLACAYYYRLVTHPLCEWLHKRQIACGVLFIIKKKENSVRDTQMTHCTCYQNIAKGTTDPRVEFCLQKLLL